jgi:O-antigen polymerase
MSIHKQTIFLPDILIAVWSLLTLIQMSLQGTITESSSFHFLLFIGCYLAGRLIDRSETLEKICAITVISVAALCLFYAIYDITTFQYPTIVSLNSSALAIQMAIAASTCFAVIRNNRFIIMRGALGIAACIFVSLIFLLECRTAFIALTGGAFYVCYRKLKIRHVWIRLLLFSVLLIAMALVLTLVTKVDSSAGRWFIWKNSWRLFQQNWLTGVGTGLFNRSYNHLQADYFFKHAFSVKEAMLADDGFYAFNEWLHVGVEQGVLGLFMFLSLTFFLLYTCWKRIEDDYVLPGAVLVSIFISCLFSYPLHNWLILSVAAFFSGSICKGARAVWHIYTPRWLVIASLLILINFTCIAGFLTMHSFTDYKKARDLAAEGAKTEAYELIKSQSAALKTHPSFPLFYLKLLHETGRLQEAITWFNKFHAFQCDQRMHAIAGKCYAESGVVELAEKHLIMSLYITPHLMQSRMDLLNFYHQQGDTLKARFWANDIIHFTPKINSPKSYLLKREAARYIAISN